MAEWDFSIEGAGLGAYLRREREERGISIADVAGATRVRALYIQRIEAEKFDDLPAVPICRGFIRAYASYLHLDAEKVVRYYNDTVGSGTEDTTDGLVVKKHSGPASSPKLIKLLLPIAMTALFILGSGTFLWFLKGKTADFRKLGRLIGQVKSAVQPIANELKNLNVLSNGHSARYSGDVRQMAVPKKFSYRDDSNAERPNVQKFPRKTKVHESAKPAASPTKSSFGEVKATRGWDKTNLRLGLTIKALEDTWLRLRVDSKRTFELLLAGGSQKTWWGTGKFVLTVGNSAGTRVFLNGSAIPLPQTTSNVLREFVITGRTIDHQQASSLRAPE